MTRDKTYKCSICGEVFEFNEEWSHEDAADEFKVNFGEELNNDNGGIVCDDCYNKHIEAAKMLDEFIKELCRQFGGLGGG